MATPAPDSVSIESEYVFFGTVKCTVIKPTVVLPTQVTVNVQDTVSVQRVSIQIACKHLCKAWLCQSGRQEAVAFLVNRFCASKIRDALQIATVPEATVGNSIPYFDPESARVCQRYMLIDISKCSENELHTLRRALLSMQESKLLIKAQNNARGIDVNASSSEFIGTMDENDFVNLLRDIGLNDAQVLGTEHNMASRLNHSGMANVISPAAPPQSSSAQIHSHTPATLSTIRPLGTKSSPVAQLRNSSYPPCAPRVVTVTQNRPVNINIVRVVPYQNSTSFITSLGAHAARGSIVTQPITHQRNIRICVRPPIRSRIGENLSTVTYNTIQTQAIKRLNNSQQTTKSSTNELSTSRFGMLLQDKKGSTLSNKRVVHVIDDDDEECGSSAQAKEPRLDLLLNYPRDQPNSISIHYADVEYLRPNEMLNDTIIEFYLKYIHMELVPPERRSSIFIFSPFFYSRLTQLPTLGPSVMRTISSRAKWIAENYKRVRMWTKNVDIFSADYVVIPIVEDIHWYLAIIAFPRFSIVDAASSEDDDRNENNIIPKKFRKTRIIILDSLADATDLKRKLTAAVLRDYLVCEYEDKRKAKDQNAKCISKERMEKIVPLPVPQQRNYTDCGLFLLKFAECFLLKPPLFITRNDSFKRWYPNFSIKGMRRAILEKLKSACGKEAWKAYEDFSRRHGKMGLPFETAFAEQESNTRSPSPVQPRRRTLSAGDSFICSHEFPERERSLPPLHFIL